MPREQQICERLAPSLIYLFPRLCGFGESRILLSISCSYLANFKWRDSHSLSSPHTTHFHFYTLLRHFDSFPSETRLVSLKSIPTLVPIEKSVLTLITQKKAPNPTLTTLIPLILTLSLPKQPPLNHHHPYQKETQTLKDTLDHSDSST